MNGNALHYAQLIMLYLLTIHSLCLAHSFTHTCMLVLFALLLSYPPSPPLTHTLTPSTYAPSFNSSRCPLSIHATFAFHLLFVLMLHFKMHVKTIVFTIFRCAKTSANAIEISIAVRISIMTYDTHAPLRWSGYCRFCLQNLRLPSRARHKLVSIASQRDAIMTWR